MNLQQLEARLQHLIEVDLLKVLPGHHVKDVIVQKLATVIQKDMLAKKEGDTLLPDVFTLVVHPDTAKIWQDEYFTTVILNSITATAQESGFHFMTAPTITLKTEEQLSIEDVEISTSYRMDTMAETNATPAPQNTQQDNSEHLPENAFLIIEGVKIYPLTQPVINIGRRLDNQLIIDDPRISRNHAQLRAIKGRFVVFDLNSTGGTFVNGQRTTQTVLYPGDVISLAGVALIFGQDNPPASHEQTSTTPTSAVSDRPTAVFNKDHSTANFKK